MIPIKYITPFSFGVLSKKMGSDDVLNYSVVEEMFADENIKEGVEFERQKPIGKYSVDFYYPKNNLVLEIDGKEYHSSYDQMDHDNNRDNFMTSKGFIVVRVNASMIKEYANQIIKIIQYIPKNKIGVFHIDTESDIQNYWNVIGETL